MKKLLPLLLFVLLYAPSLTATPAVIGSPGLTIAQPAGSKNVKTDCGATGNGTTDDYAAINTCITSLAANQTLYFPNGTYIISQGLTLTHNHSYVCQSNNAIIQTQTNGNTWGSTDFNDPLSITLNNCAVVGGAFYINGPASGAEGLTIINNLFRDNTAPPPQSFESSMFIMAEEGFGGAAGVVIKNNTFRNLLYNGQTRVVTTCDTNPPASTPNYDCDVPRSAVFAFGFDHASIDHNLFDNVYEGVKGCFAHTTTDTNVYIGYNIFNQTHRMPVEIQSGQGCNHPSGVEANGVTIEYNLAKNWNDYYWESFGISLADASANSIVRNNVVTSPEDQDPNGNVGIGYEVGGTPLHAYNNVGYGPWGLGVGVFDFSVNPVANDNWLCQMNPSSYNPNSPTVGCEQCGSFGAPPVNPVYTPNFLHNSCPGTRDISATTSISLGTASVSAGSVAAAATVSTHNPSIAEIQAFIDGNRVQTNTVSSYTLAESVSLPQTVSGSVSGLSAGQHTLTAQAVDVWGDQWTSNAQTFQVAGGCPIANGSYTIANKLSGLLIYEPLAQTTVGLQMVQWAANGSTAQQWTLVANGLCQYTITSVRSGLALEDDFGALRPLTQQMPTPFSNQLWTVSSIGGGYYTIQNAATGNVIDNANGSLNQGNPLICFPLNGGSNQAWQFTQTVAQQIAGDMGTNEAHPHGVPSSYDFYTGSYIQQGNNIAPNTAVIFWGDLYVGPNGNPATNTKVAIKNVQLWWLRKSTGQWVQGLAPTTTFDGGYYSEDFTTDFGTTVPQRVESDGSISITTSSGEVAHIFAPFPRISVDNTDIAGFVSLMEARLVLDNASGTDDRSIAQFLLESGADPYPTTTGPGIENNTAIGGGKFKFVTTQWRSFAMTTMTQAQLTANPPPIDLTGISP